MQGSVLKMRALRLNLTGRTVETIFIGGGTPSLLPPSAIERILAAVRQVFSGRAGCGDHDGGESGDIDAGFGSRLPECRGQPPESGAAVGFGGGIAALGRIHTREQFYRVFVLRGTLDLTISMSI